MDIEQLKQIYNEIGGGFNMKIILILIITTLISVSQGSTTHVITKDGVKEIELVGSKIINAEGEIKEIKKDDVIYVVGADGKVVKYNKGAEKGMTTKEPELRDEVKSKVAPDIAGTVIAKYPGTIEQGNLIDVRLFDEKIYYGTPAKNWEVVKENDE